MVETEFVRTRVACVRRVWPPYLPRLTSLPPTNSSEARRWRNEREKYHRHHRFRPSLPPPLSPSPFPPLQVRLLIPPAAAALPGRWRWRWKAGCEQRVATVALAHIRRRARTTSDGDGDRARHLIRGEPTHTRAHTLQTHARTQTQVGPASFVLQTFSVRLEPRQRLQGRRTVHRQQADNRTRQQSPIWYPREYPPEITNFRCIGYLHILPFHNLSTRRHCADRSKSTTAASIACSHDI